SLFSGVIANAALLVHMPRNITHANRIVKLCVRHYTSVLAGKSPAEIIAFFSRAHPGTPTKALHRARQKAARRERARYGAPIAN
ncbi:MAG: hypothetical protein ACREWG_02775, partial [Gammaproteobacteria bacterium]